MLGFSHTNDNRLLFELPPQSPFQVWMHLKGWEGDEPESLRLKQVHGKTIQCVEDMATNQGELEGDGILLSQEGTAAALASLRYADCVPVVICSGGSPNWLLGLHSGFQGTWQNIVASGLDSARRHAGIFDAGNLSAWIGPSIGPCCYSRCVLGDPVTLKALKDFAPDAATPVSDYQVIFDLRTQIRHQLIAEGLTPESIFIWPDCTACAPETYHSYRRGEQKKRMTLFLSRR